MPRLIPIGKFALQTEVLRGEGVERVLKRYAIKDERIRYVILGENKGIAGNTNAAIEMAAGDFVVLADHDDTLAPDALF